MFGDRVCNTTLEDSTLFSELKIYHGYTFHEWGLVVSACFGAGAVLLSGLLLFLHAGWSNNWRQRKYVLRILFMIPLYAVVSFLSYYYYLHAIYFEVLRDCYEAYALANFYWLLLAYCGETKDEQKQYLVSTPMRANWTWPIGTFQRWFNREGKPPAKRWLRIVHLGIFQYCAVRVSCTIVACITQYYGIYCANSNSMYFAHVYVEVFEALGVTFAMYSLVDLYFELRSRKASDAGFPPELIEEATSLGPYSSPERSDNDFAQHASTAHGPVLGAGSARDLNLNLIKGYDGYDRVKDDSYMKTQPAKGLLDGHRVEWKVASIKLVIFFSFWQNLVVSMLLTYGAFKPSEKIGYNDFQVGLPAMLICIEMFLFSFLHLYAFSFLESMPMEHPSLAPPVFRSDMIPGARWIREKSRSPRFIYKPVRLFYAVMEALNPFDVLRAMRECVESIWRVCLWTWGSCTHYKTFDYQKSQG